MALSAGMIVHTYGIKARAPDQSPLSHPCRIDAVDPSADYRPCQQMAVTSTALFEHAVLAPIFSISGDRPFIDPVDGHLPVNVHIP